MTVRLIQRIVAAHYGITVERMMSDRRHFVVTRARHVAMYIARSTLKESYPSLGRAFKRDHTSVLDGFRRIDALVASDAGVKADIDAIVKRVAEYKPGTDVDHGVCPGCNRPYEAQSVESLRADMARIQARIEEMAMRGAA